MSVASRIALVTVLFNSEKHLPLFFECLGRQTDRNFIVVLIDNASRDGSLARAHELAQLHGVPCEFIANADNFGVAAGNNQGIERARAMGLQHLVLINNDIACDDRLVAQIRERAIVPQYRAWTCLAYHGDSKERWYGGGRLSYWLARGIHNRQAESERVTEPVSVTYAPTCLMYLHACVFDTVGMMDARYFAYYDDTDYCYRMWRAGVRLVYDPSVSFRHYVGGSSGGDLSDFFLRISTRNKFFYIRKNYRYPGRALITFIALASKLGQLLSKKRRGPTLAGLREALASDLNR